MNKDNIKTVYLQTKYCNLKMTEFSFSLQKMICFTP